MTIKVERVGSTGRAFRISSDGGSFDIRTQSSRRYLVVSLGGRYVLKRTNNATVARREAARVPITSGRLGAVALDTVTGELI